MALLTDMNQLKEKRTSRQTTICSGVDNVSLALTAPMTLQISEWNVAKRADGLSHHITTNAGSNSVLSVGESMMVR